MIISGFVVVTSEFAAPQPPGQPTRTGSKPRSIGLGMARFPKRGQTVRAVPVVAAQRIARLLVQRDREATEVDFLPRSLPGYSMLG